VALARPHDPSIEERTYLPRLSPEVDLKKIETEKSRGRGGFGLGR
jgi:hypothetical protein